MLKLSAIQDIGGCRVIVPTAGQVLALVDKYKGERVHGKFKHVLDDENDYIREPKRRTGYRGIHLIFRHRSQAHPEYDGLKIELQFRSVLQHTWATAVETVDLMDGSKLKMNEGDPRWLRFFKLIASEFACIEQQPLVAGTPTDRAQLRREIRALAADLGVEPKLSAFMKVNEKILGQRSKAKVYLIAIDPVKRLVRTTGYLKRETNKAITEMVRIERDNPEIDAVVVSADSLAELHRAYPNYRADSARFLTALANAVRE
jgi:hypothetical protein